jgi:hypothetical protein
MPRTVLERQATALIGRCYAGLDATGLREEVLRRLRRMLPVDAAFFATVDPMTLLFTSAAADEPLDAATPLFLDNEFGREDVNKFAVLAESADPVASLDRATRGRRPASARYREIMGPLTQPFRRAPFNAGGRPLNLASPTLTVLYRLAGIARPGSTPPGCCRSTTHTCAPVARRAQEPYGVRIDWLSAESHVPPAHS